MRALISRSLFNLSGWQVAAVLTMVIVSVTALSAPDARPPQVQAIVGTSIAFEPSQLTLEVDQTATVTMRVTGLPLETDTVQVLLRTSGAELDFSAASCTGLLGSGFLLGPTDIAGDTAYACSQVGGITGPDGEVIAFDVTRRSPGLATISLTEPGPFGTSFFAGGLQASFDEIDQLEIGPPTVPPVSDPGGPYEAEEGSTLVLDGSGSADPDGTIVLYEWELDGDETFDTSDTSPDVIFDAASIDGPRSIAVSLRVTDDDGLSATTTTTLTVNNVPPTVSATGDEVDEGSTAQVDVQITDPAPADTHTATVDWGDGTDPELIDPATSPLSVEHLYADNGTFTVTVTVTDDDGGEGVATTEVVVNNVAPTVSATGDEVDEGSTAQVDAQFTDSSAADTHIATVDWGDGSLLEVIDPATSPLSVEHLYADNGTFIVTVTVTDDDGGEGVATTEVVVANVAPTVTATGDSVMLGEQATVGVEFTDPASADTYTATVDWGDGSAPEVIDPATSPFDVTHEYLTEGTFTVTVTITDDDSGEGADTAEVLVTSRPVPSSIEFAGPNEVLVGQTITIDLDMTVPAGTEAFQVGLLFDRAGLALSSPTCLDPFDGFVAPPVVLPGGDGEFFGCAAFPILADFNGTGGQFDMTGLVPGNYDIAFLLLEQDDLRGTQYTQDGFRQEFDLIGPPLSISVRGDVNRSPVSEPGGPYKVGEGSTVLLDGSGSSDPDGTIVLYEWDIDGDGTFDTASTSPEIVFDAADIDGPRSIAVSLRVTDNDEAKDVATTTVTINNVAPTASATGDEVDEGSTAQVDVQFTDPATADTHIATIDWGDGSLLEVIDPTTSPLSPGHVYADDGTFTVTVTVTDDDGGEGVATTEVVVNNVAPTVTATGDEVDEGSTAQVDVEFTDPASADTHTATIDWGDGSLLEVIDPTTSPLSPGHVYADDGTFTVTVTVTDDDGGEGVATTEVVVNNVAPTVTATGDSVTLGEQATVGVEFTDPASADTHTATVDWGDGSDLDVVDPATSPFDATHEYLDEGTFTVAVTVTDDDGGEGVATTEVVVTSRPVPSSIEFAGPNEVMVGQAITIDLEMTIPVGTEAFQVGLLFDRAGLALSGATCLDPFDGFSAPPVVLPGGDGEFFGCAAFPIAADFSGTGGQFDMTGLVPGDYEINFLLLEQDDLRGTQYTQDGFRQEFEIIGPSHSIRVVGLPPVSDPGGPYEVGEGSTVGLDGSGSTDPDGTIVLYEWDLDGDGTFDTSSTSPDGVFDASGIDGPRSIAVSLRVTDNHGLSNTAMTEVVVNNVAPTVSATGDEVDEGSTAQVDVQFTDPASTDTHSATIDWGDGSDPEVIDPATSPLTVEHLYTDNGTFTVTVTVTDDDGGEGVAATDVVVNNVAPTVSATGDEVDEGSTAQVDVQFTDPSAADTHKATIDWGDGSDPEVIDPAISPMTVEHLYTDNGTFTVTVTVTDDDGGEGAATTEVVVNNVAPTAAIVGDVINEGDEAEIAAALLDPGVLDSFTVTIDWGDGSAPEDFTFPAGTQQFTASHAYPDDDPTGTPSDDYNVGVTITDKDGGEVQTIATVTVNNVAPTVSTTGDSVPLGEQASVTVQFSDPAPADTHIATVDWGDGSDPEVIDPAASPLSLEHLYADEGTFTVTVTVMDDDTGESVATTEVVVDNITPAVSVTGEEVDEGSTTRVDVQFTDPTPGDTHTATIDWGDGSDVAVVDPATSPFSLEHVYADDGTFTVTVTVTDSDGGEGVATTEVVVNNVAPTVTATGDSVVLGEQAAVGIEFLDPASADTHTATIDWGDGSAPEVIDPATSPLTLPHDYLSAGTFTVTVTVTDDDGGEGVATTQVVVEAATTGDDDDDDGDEDERDEDDGDEDGEGDEDDDDQDDDDDEEDGDDDEDDDSDDD